MQVLVHQNEVLAPTLHLEARRFDEASTLSGSKLLKAATLDGGIQLPQEEKAHVL